MLHDPRHDKTPTLAGFALFVASKPEDELYEWTNCHKCAVGQYLQSIGRAVPLCSWDGVLHTMNTLAHGGGTTHSTYDVTKWRFGALADRILRYQMSELAIVA